MAHTLDEQAKFGLTTAEVIASRAQHGANSLTRRKRRGFWFSLLVNFGDPMIKVLLIALGINIIFLFNRSDWFETVGIALAVLIAVVVSTISEYSSQAVFDQMMREALLINCRVRRNGRTASVLMPELVVGDIVMLGAGERVPADGQIIEGRLEVDQSALNGESNEAHKYVSSGAASRPGDLLDPSLIFGGTVVTGGSAVMRVTSVGDGTVYGQLAAEVQEDSPVSPLKTKLEQLAGKISLFGYVAAVLVVLAYLFNVLVIDNGFDTQRILVALGDYVGLAQHLLVGATLAVSVIVMAVPEGLPMMITVVLSTNIRRMLRDQILVRKLSGIETAGSMNILFSDKTGTLTTGQLGVMDFCSGDCRVINATQIATSGFGQLVKRSLLVNNSAEMVDSVATGGNATDRALCQYADSIASSMAPTERLRIVPFDGTAKYMATTIRSAGVVQTLIKGAPEKILPHCTHFYQANGQVAPLSNIYALQGLIDRMARRSLRIIVLATLDGELDSSGQFGGLTLVGLISLRDQIRPEAVRGVAQVRAAGIQTVMITGDALTTAVAIAREVGIINSQRDRSLTSDDLARLSDAQLAQILPSLRVVARALPRDKSRLVRVAQSLNLVVGMTGDGVNDAPALKKADIGFAMGSGTEVAKETSDIVLLDDNFASIARTIAYGRTIFKSIRKFIIYQLTINFCAVSVAILAPLLNISDTPITVIQMLWINLVMDTLAGMAFGGERPRANYMLEPPKKRSEPIINSYMWQQIILGSIFIATMCLLFLKSDFIRQIFDTQGNAYFMTAFFTLLMLASIVNSLNARTHELNLLDYLVLNKQFIWIMSSITALQILIIYFGGELFGTRPLEPMHLGIIVGMALLILPFDLCRKAILRKTGWQAGT